MNFEKAFKDLKAGKRIRRKEWEPLQFMVMEDKKIVTYRGEYSNFYGDVNLMLDEGWYVDGEDKDLNFVEVVEALKIKQKVRNRKWNPDCFIFIDKDKIAICKPVAYEFMPTYQCFCASDWEILK